MANDFELGPLARSAACDGLVDYIDTGTGAGKIEIRTGSQPANVNDASTGTLIATLTFSATAFGAASTGVAAAASITSDTNCGSGDAGYFRIYRGADGDTLAVAQGTCGEAADAPVDIQFDEKTFVAGGTVAITSLSITIPIQ